MEDGQSYTVFETGCGHVALAWSTSGVTGLRLPSSTERAAEAFIVKRRASARRDVPTPTIAGLVADIKRYFDGAVVDFGGVALDLGEQDPFFAKVYDEIRKLRRGETTTYGDIAKSLGAEPQAARDVGVAMATNPVPLIVPCHRVLAAGGRIGGFSAPGGPLSKARMLEIEGVQVPGRRSRKAAKAPSAQIGFEFR